MVGMFAGFWKSEDEDLFLYGLAFRDDLDEVESL
jgi:hypothetical protein